MTKFGLTVEKANTLTDHNVSMVYDRGEWILQITVPQEALRAHAGEDGRLISGDLILQVRLPFGSDEGSAEVSIVEIPH